VRERTETLSLSIVTERWHHAHRKVVTAQLEREELQTQRSRLAIEAAGLQELLAAAEAHDIYTGEHSKAMMGLAAEVAWEMGLPEQEIVVVRHAALLHDVGKVWIPDPILNKRGPLEEEREVMQVHVEVGACMVASVESLAHLAPIVRATHEHWDGTGYPDGLSGEEIPLASRIVHACDAWHAWHAMTSDRPYREALGVERWNRKLEENMGKQLDPRVVLALVEVLKTHFLLPPGEIERIIGEVLCLA
jgi:putative nucleotidyltransferase with HDIG domain